MYKTEITMEMILMTNIEQKALKNNNEIWREGGVGVVCSGGGGITL